jgi:hypothetical protein
VTRQLATAIAAMTALGLATAAVAAGTSPVTCPFMLATQRPCIFCGMTHALIHALGGDWHAASAANPAWLMIVAAMIIAAAGCMLRWRGVTAAVIGCVMIASVARAVSGA